MCNFAVFIRKNAYRLNQKIQLVSWAISFISLIISLIKFEEIEFIRNFLI